MLRLGKPITIATQIVETTASIIFKNEEIIITKIDEKSFGHFFKKRTIQNEHVWSIYYLEDYEYFNLSRTRTILIEKYQKKGHLYWHYDFYEPVQLIGKGSELDGYEEMFSELLERNSIFTPETTLILKRTL